MNFTEAVDAMDRGCIVGRRAKEGRLALRMGDIVVLPNMPFAPPMPAFLNLEDIRADDWEVSR